MRFRYNADYKRNEGRQYIRYQIDCLPRPRTGKENKAAKRVSRTQPKWAMLGDARDPLNGIEVLASWGGFTEGEYTENPSTNTLFPREAPSILVRALWAPGSGASSPSREDEGPPDEDETPREPDAVDSHDQRLTPLSSRVWRLLAAYINALGLEASAGGTKSGSLVLSDLWRFSYLAECADERSGRLDTRRRT